MAKTASYQILSNSSSFNYNLKLKLFYYTLRKRLGERMHSFYSFATSALDGGEWSASRPGRALAPEKGPPVPIVQEAGWVPEPVWTKRLEEKSLRLAGDAYIVAWALNTLLPKQLNGSREGV
jgi:hypothetical protein